MYSLKNYSTKEKSRKFTLSDDQKQEIKEAFDLFDTEKSGKIDFNELKVTLKALGFDIPKKEVVELIKEYDVEEIGRIEYLDFVEISKINSDKEIFRKRSSR